MRRPGGITVLCLILAWLTFAAAGNSYFILTGQFAGLPVYLGVFAVAYGVSALVACIGLWRMKRWGMYWLRAWMVICLGMFAAMIPSLHQIAFGRIVGFGAFIVSAAGLFWLLHRYVAAKVAPIA